MQDTSETLVWLAVVFLEACRVAQWRQQKRTRICLGCEEGWQGLVLLLDRPGLGSCHGKRQGNGGFAY